MARYVGCITYIQQSGKGASPLLNPILKGAIIMKKTSLITFRVSEHEEAKLKSDANEIGLNVSEYIRKNISQEPIIKIYHPKELLRQISSIGNNINQIARHANTYDTLTTYDIQQLKSDISNLKWQVYKFIGSADIQCQ